MQKNRIIGQSKKLKKSKILKRIVFILSGRKKKTFLKTKAFFTKNIETSKKTKVPEKITITP